MYPPSIPPEQLRLAEEVAVESVRALGLRDAIAFPQLIASPDGSVAVVEVAARIPGGQMADLVRHAVGVDLVEVALRQALGEDVPDEVALPRFTQPLAIRFFTAEPGPLPTGEVDEDRHASTPCSPRRASSRRTRTCRSARRSAPSAATATAAATSSPSADTSAGGPRRAELAATRLEVEVAA